jgi:hypothetical protein
MVLSTETHSYDGKLSKLSDTPTLSLEQCVQEIQTQCSDPIVHRSLKLITSGVGNMDTANNLDASIVLRLSWERVRETEVITVYFEQLADIVMSGPCPQGRTTRLMQFLL